MTRRIITAAIVLGLLIAGLALAQQPEGTIADHAQAMRQALGGSDHPQVFTQARELLQVAAALDPQTLDAADLYAIGQAHSYLMAEAYDRAITAGGLSDEQLAQATKMRDAIMAAGPAIKVVSHGEEIDLADHLVAGKTNIVDFYSDYCGPCKMIAPILEDIVTRRPDIALLKVDINRPDVRGIDWGSPVARQYELSGIPYLRIYGPDGQMVSDGVQARQQIMEWANEG